MLISPTIQHLHGRIFLYTGADPAANTESTITVPSHRRWLIRAYRIALTTDANAITRTVSLKIDDGTDSFFISTAFVTQIENLTRHYYFAPITKDPGLVFNRIAAHLPPLLLAPGYRITTYTDNLQVTDNFDAPVLLVEEWIDP